MINGARHGARPATGDRTAPQGFTSSRKERPRPRLSGFKTLKARSINISVR
ncbi:hypothetical protein BT93_F1960 [Corymbia citriodora subsp. variegata]|nr:hypothetical protein BT93_F1960 [Corymbia citriodora subsp. variegata]